MLNKVFDIYKKRQNLVLGLLIALFLVLLFAQTLSMTSLHADVTVKDFSIMRPVSVPTQGDVRTVLGIFKDEIGADLYSFDHLYNNVYSLFVFGIIALVMCFTKFNTKLVSKVITLAYGAFGIYSVLATNNMAYILKTYDNTYVLKIVVAVLITVISIGALVLMIKELAKNEWLKFVNVHSFLNGFCAVFMLATLAIMFMPFVYEKFTASVMGFTLLPSNYAGDFYKAYKSLLGDVTFNSSMIIPILVLILGIMGSIINISNHKNIVAPVMSIVWAVFVAIGALLNPLMAMDSNFIIHIVLAVATIAAAVINLIQHHKANAIYRN